jgi:PEP-CTERM motif
MKYIKFFLGGIAAFSISATASAVELKFSWINNCCAYTDLVSWTQLSSPVVTSSDIYGQSFTIDVSGSAVKNNFGTYGETTYFSSMTYYSYTSPYSGGGFSNELTGGTGLQIYTGSMLSPIFTPGVYNLAYGSVLTVSPAAPAVPEPATWAMMLVGMGAIGVAVRRRQNTSASCANA